MGQPVMQYDENVTLALGALGALDAIDQSSKVDTGRGNGFRVIRARLAAMLEAKTATEGPIVWGIGMNVNAADLEAMFEADPSSSATRILGPQRSYIMPLGIIGKPATEGALTGKGGETNIGQFVEITPNWSVPEGQNLNYWAYNMDSGALTTGTLIRIFAQLYGVWLRD